MELNNETRLAWEFVEHTGRSVFLTGKAGTGKTTFLRYVREHSAKRMVVVAPTGVAAINAGGVTIHSFFQLPLSPFLPETNIKSRFDFSKEKKKIIRTIDMVVIDEISMVRSDLLDAVDAVLRRLRGDGRPFGGVQLVMIGDLQQLTPVVTPEEEQLLRNYYDTPYFFGSKALAQVDYVTIQLEKVYRQQDGRFLDILNHIRDGQTTQEDLQLLNSRMVSNPHHSAAATQPAIRLTTHNNLANSYNRRELDSLPAHPFTFDADIEGTFPEYAYPTDVSLTLKEGAQVMFVKNDPSADHLYYNGRIGRITELTDHSCKVYCEGDDEAIEVMPQRWENARYTLNAETKEIETEVQGTFTQLPLRLAWAITIHKSQGLTFDRVIIDAGLSFAPGQVYVALSRCRTLEGMTLSTPIEPHAIINDQRVSHYILHQSEAAEDSIRQLPALKEEYEMLLLIDLFTFSNIGRTEESLSRLLTEFLYKQYNALVNAHKQATQDFTRRVMLVAYKWTNVIKATPHQKRTEPEFRQRVERSCRYFDETLDAIFDDLIGKTRTIETKNQELKKRLLPLIDELVETYNAKRQLLQHIAEHGFTTEYYLRTKQLALLHALEKMETPDRRRGTASKGKKQKTVQKADTTDTYTRSYRLFCEGHTARQVAELRGLTYATVINHLTRFVKEGKLQVDQILPEKLHMAITEAIFKAGPDASNTAVKIFCPPDTTYSEIDLVKAGQT